ncbi:MAG TPA: phosphatase [Bacteroidia bacterium]|nr:phosphatase [Bacteroidia bacterium]
MAKKHSIEKIFQGRFLTSPAKMQSKFEKVKAFLFDWDGVFNNGQKDHNGSSLFNEVDSMGTNLLRFNHYQRKGKLPIASIISGEKNAASFMFAEREHFNSVYYSVKHKATALEHFCKDHKVTPAEIAFVFDDVLDFSIANQVGIRIMIGRESNPLLENYTEHHKLADYITACDGGNHGVREATEVLMGLTGNFDNIIDHRLKFSKTYSSYFTSRNSGTTKFYTNTDSGIINKRP